MKKYVLPLLLMLCLAVRPLMAQELIEKNYEGIEVLEMDIGGVDVIYTGIEGRTAINLKAMFGSDEDGARNFFMVTVGNTLKLSYKSPKANFVSRDKRFIHLEGPMHMRISGKNSSGTLSVRGLISDKTSLSVGSGVLEVQNLQGDLTAKGNSGKVDVKQLNGNLEGSISSGRMVVAGVSGNAVLNGSSGSISAKNVEGRLDLKITSGMARIDQVGELGDIALSSGSIKATHAGLGPHTQLKGSSGSLDIQTDSDLKQYNYDLGAKSGSVRVGNIGHGKTLVLNYGAAGTVSGSISSGAIKIDN